MRLEKSGQRPLFSFFGSCHRAASTRWSELGASLIEYALLVGLIAMVCLLAVTFFGGNVSHSMSTSASSVAGT